MMFSRFETAQATKTLSLALCGIKTLPTRVFSIDLYRLDVGFNCLREFSPSIALLKESLCELWINDNPIETVPAEVGQLQNLRVLDLRNTRIRTLPTELCLLPQLAIIDVRGCGFLEDELVNAASKSTENLVSLLRKRYDTAQLQTRIEERLSVVYRDVLDSCEGQEHFERLIKNIMQIFPNLQDLRDFLRNSDRLLPADLAEADATTMQSQLEKLKAGVLRQKLNAELELKLRALYFDMYYNVIVIFMLCRYAMCLWFTK
jgi:hypothetical protein